MPSISGGVKALLVIYTILFAFVFIPYATNAEAMQSQKLAYVVPKSILRRVTSGEEPWLPPIQGYSAVLTSLKSTDIKYTRMAIPVEQSSPDILPGSPDYVPTYMYVYTPDPYDANTWIYAEYSDILKQFKESLSSIMQIKYTEGATYSQFLNLLGGTTNERPIIFHFAGHGGYTSDGAPYLLVRDDNNPDKFTQLNPSDINSRIPLYRLSNYTRLVYFSSCYSARNIYKDSKSESFGSVLTKYLGASYFIGYSDAVDSEIASIFNHVFYINYLKNIYMPVNQVLDQTEVYFTDLGLTLTSTLKAIIYLLLLDIIEPESWLENLAFFLAMNIAYLLIQNFIEKVLIVSKTYWKS